MWPIIVLQIRLENKTTTRIRHVYQQPVCCSSKRKLKSALNGRSIGQRENPPASVTLFHLLFPGRISYSAYLSVRIHIIDIKSKTQFVTDVSVWIDVYSEKKFHEIDITIIIGVEGSEHLTTVFFSFMFWIEFLVDFCKLSWWKFSIWTITKKCFMPLTNLLRGIIGISCQTIDHITGQFNADNFTFFASHIDDNRWKRRSNLNWRDGKIDGRTMRRTERVRVNEWGEERKWKE